MTNEIRDYTYFAISCFLASMAGAETASPKISLEPASAMVVRLGVNDENKNQTAKSAIQTAEAHSYVYPDVFQNPKN